MNTQRDLTLNEIALAILLVVAAFSFITVTQEYISDNINIADAAIKKPGNFNATDDYNYGPTNKTLGESSYWLSSEVGYVIIAVMIIVGTALIGIGLYKRAQADQPHDAKGSLMKVGIGSALVVFALVIGIAIKTLSESTK